MVPAIFYDIFFVIFITMENNKEKNVVPALKLDSGFGSGIKASSRNQIFTKNIVLRRNELHYSQQKLSDITGVKLRTIQNYEGGSKPKAENCIAIAEGLKCSLDWLMLNKGPEPGPPGEEKQIDRPAPLYNKVEAPVAGVGDRMVEYSAGMDLKDKLIRSQEKLISHLEKENNNLKAQLEAKYATNNMS